MESFVAGRLLSSGILSASIRVIGSRQSDEKERSSERELCVGRESDWA
jgi:hypothetical protein